MEAVNGARVRIPSAFEAPHLNDAYQPDAGFEELEQSTDIAVC